MLNNEFMNQLNRSPVIFSMKDEQNFKRAVLSDYKILFFLFGDIATIADHISLAKQHGKIVFVHLDLINGMASHEAAVEFISKYTDADGVISTKPRLLRYAKKFDLLTILRIFMLDSMAFENGIYNIEHCEPDLVEILPGIATKSFALVREHCDLPLIAGGFIRNQKDMLDAISAGASAVSSTRFELHKVNKAIADSFDSKEEE
ncbi:MAG: glycerol-3-phosphate responsive antiterminator [Clostridiaceae bacterium]|nr:glycerol-3-phosphate responsive antiterminator [Clostridiaceae bacterium]